MLKPAFFLPLIAIIFWSCEGETSSQAQAKAALNAGQIKAPAQRNLKLTASDLTLSAGGKGCVDVTAIGFQQLLSMQYTMKWDPKVLRYTHTQDFSLPFLNPQCFGEPRAPEGLLPCVWIDNHLQGITLPDQGVLFRVCFEAIGEAGQSTAFEFVQQPTPFEVVNLQEKVLPLEGVAGTVRVE